MVSPFALPSLIVLSLDYFGRIRGEVLFLVIRPLDLYGAMNIKFTHLLLCSNLRLQGFNADNPPHLCEELTNKAVKFTAKFL